jgi:hypothetical protein
MSDAPQVKEGKRVWILGASLSYSLGVPLLR